MHGHRIPSSLFDTERRQRRNACNSDDELGHGDNSKSHWCHEENSSGRFVVCENMDTLIS